MPRETHCSCTMSDAGCARRHAATSTQTVKAKFHYTGPTGPDRTRSGFVLVGLKIGTTLLPWARGKPMAWDVTVPDTYAEYHIGNTATKPGAAAQKTAQNKIDKYSKLGSTHIFYPFAIETAGTWHEMAIELTQEIAAGVSPLSQKTSGRQHSCSNAFPWLCKQEMRFLSTTPW